MKVAICISGLAREFKRSYNALNKFIFSQFEHDLFIYTWNAPNQPYFEVEGAIRYPDEGTLEEYKNLYNPVLMGFEVFDKNRENLFKNEKYERFKSGATSVVRMSAMFYQIMRCNQIKNLYAEKHGIKYDIVIKCRSDIVPFRPFDLKEFEDARDNGTFYSDVLRNDGMVSDILFFSNSEVMDYACDLYKYFDEYVDRGIRFNPEVFLPYHLKEKGIVAKQHFLGNVTVLRPPQVRW